MGPSDASISAGPERRSHLTECALRSPAQLSPANPQSVPECGTNASSAEYWGKPRSERQIPRDINVCGATMLSPSYLWTDTLIGENISSAYSVIPTTSRSCATIATMSSPKQRDRLGERMHDGRQDPRSQQLEIDAEVQRLFAEGYEVVGLNLPPGYGKSYLARGWQRKWGNTDIITANNNLIKQYRRDYPELNAVMGKTNYATSEEYESAKRHARRATPSIFNPMSALFTSPRESRSVEYTIVDEAHTLGEMLRTSAACTFNTSASGIPKWVTSEYHLVRWIKQRFQELGNVIGDSPSKPLTREYEKIGALYYAIKGQEQNSIFSVTRSKTVVRGRRIETVAIDVVDYPMGVMQQLFGDSRVVLMSGTLTKYETEKLANGRKWAWISRPYLSPPENRPVYARCLDREDRKDITKVCAEIRRIYTESGEQPMLVHVTYGDMNEYRDQLAGLRVHWNTSRNKDLIEARFRARGGIWLAGGCSEGIDLADGACRTIILPRLQFPNKGDIYVQKRLGRPDGRKWYAIKTLETTIQQLGRGNRHSADYCTGYVFDPYFPALWEEYKHEFEALNIIWGT